jgi:hypothetical protein
MVLVAGMSFRIVRVTPGIYDAVRILDDQRVGQFRAQPTLEVTDALPGCDALLSEIARSAVKSGKTSWVGRLI